MGPVGVGKSFLADALGHIACRRGHCVLATTADQMLKGLRQARLTNGYEAELRRLIAVDLLIVDDFALDIMDAQESRDAYAILVERHRAGSMIVTSNRGPDEWLATFADPVRAQSAIDRLTKNPTTSWSRVSPTAVGSSRRSLARVMTGLNWSWPMRADHQRARPVHAAGRDGLMDGANGRAAHKPLDGAHGRCPPTGPWKTGPTTARFPTAPTGRACVVRSMKGK